MARQEINLGTAPTGLGGDPPRTASQKINFMTQELYEGLATTAAPLPIAKGGTGGKTPEAARTGLGLRAAALMDVVGAGGIIERGATANGEYTKFLDGTLIQWGVITAQADTRIVNFYGSTSGDIYYVNVRVTLPTVYPSSSFSSFGNVVDRGVIGVTSADGGGGIIVQLRHTTRTDSTTTARWLTVGRWK